MRRFVQLAYLPVMLAGAGGAAVWLGSRGAPALPLAAVVAVASAVSFGAERVAPYEPDWNRSHDDAARDVAHLVVNEAANVGSVAVLGLMTAFGPSPWWPHTWPFALQSERGGSTARVVRAGQLGIAGRPAYPTRYLAQLVEPFRRVRPPRTAPRTA